MHENYQETPVPFGLRWQSQRDTALLGAGSQSSPLQTPKRAHRNTKSMEGGALRCVSEDRMTSELLPRKAPSRSTLSAHSKKLPMAGGSEGGFGRPLLAANGPSFSCISCASWAKARGQRAAKKWQRSDSAPKFNMLGSLHAGRACTRSLPPD